MVDERQTQDEQDFNAHHQKIKRGAEQALREKLDPNLEIDGDLVDGGDRYYSQLYKVKTKDGRVFYLKELKKGRSTEPEYMRSDDELEAEVRMTTTLSKPEHGGGTMYTQVVANYEVDGNPVLIYAEYPGGAVKDRLLKRLYFSGDEIAKLVDQVGTAIVRLHFSDTVLQEIIHRDVNPGNVLVDENENFLLHDFSNSYSPNNNVPDTIYMRARGTPRYMPLEAVAGTKNNEKSDLYSFAVMIYEQLTRGHVPYLKRDADGRDGIESGRLRTGDDILEERRQNTHIYISLKERGIQGSDDFNKLIEILDGRLGKALDDTTSLRTNRVDTFKDAVLEILRNPVFVAEYDAVFAAKPSPDMVFVPGTSTSQPRVGEDEGTVLDDPGAVDAEAPKAESRIAKWRKRWFGGGNK